MHKIRHAARNNAWYGNFEDHGSPARTYNVFGRVRPRRGRIDEEHQLQHIMTANDAPSPVEARRRRSDDAEASSPFSGPRKSYTFPAVSSTGAYDWSEDYAASEGGLDQIAVLETSTSAHLSENTPPRTENNSRRRKFNKFSRRRNSQVDLGDEKKAKKRSRLRLPISGQLRSLFASWTTLLLVFVPIGFAVNYTHQTPVLVFVMNFFAIVPSITIISFAIENLNMYIGETIGALLSMTFSNATQLISSIFLLKSRQIGVLQSSLLGGILQSLLVMTGLAFIFGGINRLEQHFNAQLAQTIGMLLLLAVLSLMIPTVSRLWNHTTTAGIIAQSRGTAVVIIFSYCLWLFFQLKTHREMFDQPSEKVPKRKSNTRKEPGEVLKGIAMIGAATGAATAGGRITQENLVTEAPHEEETPQLSKLVSLVVLVIFTALLAFNTQFATDSVQGIMTNHRISEEFMGIVVLPILSNDPLTIDSAIKDKMDISISLTLERCMQTALMVVPLIVLLAWAMGIDEMTLEFDGFSVAALFASIIIVTYVVQEGRSNWLTGALLLKVFLIIGLASFYIEPDSQSHTT